MDCLDQLEGLDCLDQLEGLDQLDQLEGLDSWTNWRDWMAFIKEK